MILHRGSVFGRARGLCLLTRLSLRLSSAGVLGVRLKIMLPHDPEGKSGPKNPLPDTVTIMDPKEDKPPVQAAKGADEKAYNAPTLPTRY
jgi:hypothetical protein